LNFYSIAKSRNRRKILIFTFFSSLFLFSNRIKKQQQSGLMNTTQQPTKESSQTPPGQISSYQFQPIQHQPPSLSYISKASALEAGKINATATHFELEPQANCVTSLINMSCRGRAEAFARSLQSRLRTLGSQVRQTWHKFMFKLNKCRFKGDHEELDTVDSSDTTWLNNNNNNSNGMVNNNTTATTEIQPRVVTTETTADSYFDFDMEPESPGSPIDECEYTRLIETSGSTPQEQQVPEAPESGFVCASPCSTLEGGSRGSASSSDVQFFDPESSDTGTEFFDCATEHRPHQPRRYHHLSHHKVSIRPPSPIAASPSSSESSATPTSNMNGHVRLLESGDSSESLPPSQSTNSSLSTASNFNSNSNSNSTLQDAEGEIAVDEVVDEKFTARLYDSSMTKFVKPEPDEIDDDDEELKASSPEQEAEEVEEEEVVEEPEFDQDKVLKEITTIDVLSPVVEAEEPEPPKKDSDEEEYERVPRVRRCSSLKTGKTPPGTPGRKKIVRFADVLGLDLADVRTFLDEVPKIPKSAYEDLDVTLPSQTLSLGPPLEKVLVPLFQQPGCLPNFMERLRDSQVCLESAAVTDPISLTITGCVRVRNLDFHKSVHVRYSMDDWRSYSDLTASYVENSCDGFSDKFSFILFGNSMQIGQRVEMAIRFQAKGEQFWDSNYGINYCFQCLPCSSRPNSSLVAPIEQRNESTSTDDVQTITDAMGSRQWSNTFLY
jgi:protein phosphatase 1 regulatory subunit 3A/B/C/D/E